MKSNEWYQILKKNVARTGIKSFECQTEKSTVSILLGNMRWQPERGIFVRAAAAAKSGRSLPWQRFVSAAEMSRRRTEPGATRHLYQARPVSLPPAWSGWPWLPSLGPSRRSRRPDTLMLHGATPATAFVHGRNGHWRCFYISSHSRFKHL